MYQPSNVVETEAEIRSLLGEVPEASSKKVISHIDQHCMAWIEKSPWVVVCTADESGQIDVSPKGDPAGFVRVLDDKTLAIPDRPGNRRADSLRNILTNPKVGLMFVIPGRGEVVRVSGRAQVVRDVPLLQSMAVNGKMPLLAILVRVEEAFYHCSKAVIRSRLWQPDLWPDIEGLPTYAQALVDHGNLSRSVEDMQDLITQNDERLY